MIATSPQVARFPIAFDPWYAAFSSLLGLPPSTAYVELDGDQIHVQMGWAFRSRFPRSAVASASLLDVRPLSRGVHGFAGRWLVNGSGRDIVSIRLDPAQRAHVMGVPLRLRELLISVADGRAVVAALRNPT